MMKCPHCYYEHGTGMYNGASVQVDVEGILGPFREFELPEEGQYMLTTVYACPSCRKMFVE